MSEQSPPPPTSVGQLSPDGHYRWDGSKWQPAAGTAGVPSTKGGIATIWVVLSLIFCFPLGFIFIFLSRWTQKTKLIVAGVLGGLLLLSLISYAASPKTTTSPSTASVSAQSPTPLSAADKAAAEQAAARDKAAADKAAADKAAADKAAADAAAAAAAPKTFSGTGSKVTDHFQLKQGSYKLAWKATGGSDNFQVTAHWAGDSKGLVNEIPPNPSSGETVFDAPITGDYYLEVAASTLTWTITLTPA